MKQRVPPVVHDFRAIDPSQARIVLLEAGPRVLGAFAEPLSRAAAPELAARGVEVRPGAAVTRIAPGLVEAGALSFAAETVLWAAGVQASPLAASLGVPLDRAGRVLVEPDLTVPGHPEVFVIGDLAAFLHDPATGGRPLPGLAPVAIQMGRHAAENVLKSARREAPRPFRYRERGMMATIGRNAAVAQVGRVRLTGLPAWLAWVLVHIVTLIGFRNRLLVLIEWAWAYVTFNRGVRLITGGPPAVAAPARATGAPPERESRVS